MAAQHSEAGRRAVFVEDLPPETLVSPAVIELLRSRGLSTIVSVRPWNVSATLAARRTLEAAAIPVTLWPMLEDAAGRWANVRTARALAGFVETVRAEQGTDDPPRFLLDFEPPIDDVRRVLAKPAELYRFSRLLAAPEGAADLRALLLAASCAGSPPAAALVPFVLADGPLGGVSRFLGVGARDRSLGTAWIMAYTTLFSGYSKGLVERRGALAMLSFVAARAKRRFGDGAALALGCVGKGALGDEAVYRGPEELAEDVRASIRMGIEKIALFDLAGVLARGSPERWLDAFVSTG